MAPQEAVVKTARGGGVREGAGRPAQEASRRSQRARTNCISCHNKPEATDAAPEDSPMVDDSESIIFAQPAVLKDQESVAKRKDEEALASLQTAYDAAISDKVDHNDPESLELYRDNLLRELSACRDTGITELMLTHAVLLHKKLHDQLKDLLDQEACQATPQVGVKVELSANNGGKKRAQYSQASMHSQNLDEDLEPSSPCKKRRCKELSAERHEAVRSADAIHRLQGELRSSQSFSKELKRIDLGRLEDLKQEQKKELQVLEQKHVANVEELEWNIQCLRLQVLEASGAASSNHVESRMTLMQQELHMRLQSVEESRNMLFDEKNSLGVQLNGQLEDEQLQHQATRTQLLKAREKIDEQTEIIQKLTSKLAQKDEELHAAWKAAKAEPARTMDV